MEKSPSDIRRESRFRRYSKSAAAADHAYVVIRVGRIHPARKVDESIRRAENRVGMCIVGNAHRRCQAIVVLLTSAPANPSGGRDLAVYISERSKARTRLVYFNHSVRAPYSPAPFALAVLFSLPRTCRHGFR